MGSEQGTLGYVIGVQFGAWNLAFGVYELKILQMEIYQVLEPAPTGHHQHPQPL